MKPSFSFLLFVGAFLLVIACNPEEVNIDNPPNLRVLSADEQALIQTSNDFTFDLFKTIHQNQADENIFISPLSIDIALTMTVNGASEDTKSVMKETLGLENLNDEQANEAIKELTALLLDMDKKVALSVANSIWYRNIFTLKNGFSELIQSYYDGTIEGLNFDSPTAKDDINQWVENKTQGKIKDLISQIKASDVMFLVNAIYFKADWQQQFDKDQTRESMFTLENGSQVPVQMMFTEEAEVSRYKHSLFQLVEIPYGNGQFNMVILLPNEGKTTQDVMNALNGEDLSEWIAQADSITPELYLPRFKMEFKMNLKDPLTEMGMGLPFTEDAEFHNFFNENIGEKLFIDRVIHQSFIEVNEEGSEAAAATAVVIGLESANLDNIVRVDHPFVFLIRENHTGAILFAGKMMEPEE